MEERIEINSSYFITFAKFIIAAKVEDMTCNCNPKEKIRSIRLLKLSKTQTEITCLVVVENETVRPM